MPSPTPTRAGPLPHGSDEAQHEPAEYREGGEDLRAHEEPPIVRSASAPPDPPASAPPAVVTSPDAPSTRAPARPRTNAASAVHATAFVCVVIGEPPFPGGSRRVGFRLPGPSRYLGVQATGRGALARSSATVTFCLFTLTRRVVRVFYPDNPGVPPV